MLNLEPQIAEWRQRMLAAGITSAEALEELEGHLREEVGRRTAAGEAEEVAFNLASEGLGEATALRAEFKKIEAGRWNRRLAYGAWGIFAISFFLPAFENGAGWRCAGLSAITLFDRHFFQNNWSGMHLGLLTLANLVMISSPVLIWRRVGESRAWIWIPTAVGGAAVLVWSYLGLFFIFGGWSELRIGAFAWGASFILLCAAMFRLRDHKTDAPGLSASR